jgi:hypothetical protein
LKTAILFLSVFITTLSYGQPNTFVLNSRFINKDNTKWNKEKFIKLNYPFEKANQSIITCDNKIYVTIDGTGFLYEYDSLMNKFTKIDSTRAFGYNHEAYLFSYNKAIYSLGGLGIWRQNGHLRKYNRKDKEWDIVPLNKEIPIIANNSGGLLWYDEQNGKIYSSLSRYFNAGVIEFQDFNKINHDVMVLDLKTNVWSKIGALNFKSINLTRDFGIIASSIEGLITINNGRVYFWDFINNKILVNKKSEQIYESILRGTDSSRFSYRQGLLYKMYGNEIDSIPLNLNDFVYANSIYYTYNSDAIIIIAFKKIRKNIKNRFRINIIQHFNAEELEFIKLLFLNTASDKKTTIEEINAFLVIESRSVDIQKSQRHKLISSINDKYQLIYEQDLINMTRSAMDKRVFEYYLKESEIKTVKILLKK